MRPESDHMISPAQEIYSDAEAELFIWYLGVKVVCGIAAVIAISISTYRLLEFIVGKML